MNMKRYQPNSPQRVFRGNELMRLMTMVVMLGGLFLLIARSQDPNTWAWLTNDAGASRPVQSNKSPPVSEPKETAPASGGPTDQDPEEAEAIQEQFQAVSDAKLTIAPEEMPAYNRLLQWVQNQTLSEMRRRAKKDPVFTQFYQSPEKYRGQLFELELNVRRILKYSHKDLTLYEVWGWTAESRSWPYVGVVIDPPKGMPVGPDVYETATLVGYFFKMQGYLEAGGKPHAAPLQAPLFVGRLIWRPAEKPQAQRSDWYWGVFLLAGFLFFLIIRWGLFIRGSRRRGFTPSPVQTKTGNQVEDWLAKVDSNAPPEENNANDDFDP